MEETIILRVDDLEGDEAVWLGDANTVLVPGHLDAAGYERAISSLAASWQRAVIRIAA